MSRISTRRTILHYVSFILQQAVHFHLRWSCIRHLCARGRALPQSLHAGYGSLHSAFCFKHFPQNQRSNAWSSLLLVLSRFWPQPEQGGYLHHSQTNSLLKVLPLFCIAFLALSPNSTGKSLAMWHMSHIGNRHVLHIQFL